MEQVHWTEPDDDRIVVIDGVEYIEVNGKLYNVDDLIDEGKLHRIDENGELRRDEATVEFEDGVDYVCVDGIWKPIYLHYDEDLDDEDIDDGDVDSGE